MGLSDIVEQLGGRNNYGHLRMYLLRASSYRADQAFGSVHSKPAPDRRDTGARQACPRATGCNRVSTWLRSRSSTATGTGRRSGTTAKTPASDGNGTITRICFTLAMYFLYRTRGKNRSLALLGRPISLSSKRL